MTARCWAPDARVIARRRAQLDRLLREREAIIASIGHRFPAEAAFLAEVRDRVSAVIIILGSQRGGTSAFRAVLSKAGGALATVGEHRPLFTLLGRNFPDHGALTECAESDTLTPVEQEFLLTNLLFETAGPLATSLEPAGIERFGWECALRFRMQWPTLEVTAERVHALVCDAVRGGADHLGDPGRLTIAILRRLRCAAVPVNPYYYDLDVQLVADAIPDAVLPDRPPGDLIVEVPPFLPFHPRARPDPRGVRALLIKSSADVFRIALLRALFARWEVRFIHLVRNPLAAINGLIDGWEHHSFWQHDLAALGLSLSDASDRKRLWWNFDLFDGWISLLAAPLERLCACQWLAAHERILEVLSEEPLRLHFEDFQRDPASRERMLRAAVGHTGLDMGSPLQEAIVAPAVLNRTAPPEPGRWQRLRPELVACMDLPRIRAVAERLGYRGDPRTWQ